MPSRKRRSDAFEARLTPAQRDELMAWLCDEAVGYEVAAARVRERWGVETSPAALLAFFRFWSFDFRRRRADALAEQVTQKTAHLDDAKRRALAEREYVLAMEAGDVKTVQALRVLELEAQRLELERSSAKTRAELARLRLEQGNKRLALDRERLEVAVCENFLKWFTDARAREIAASPISNAEKIAELRRTYFADVDALEAKGEVVLP